MKPTESEEKRGQRVFDDMKCKICKNKTTWDESFGRENYIVCPNCLIRLANSVDRCDDKIGQNVALNIIFEISKIKKEAEGK